MKLGIIGTGLMGSNLARCLASKGFKLVLYNRTRVKAEELAREINASIVDSPLKLVEEVDVAIVFVSGDDALLDIVFGGDGVLYGRDYILLNASTTTPMTSLRVYELLRDKGIGYVEAPVYGSTSEARECKLLSIIACKQDLRDKVEELARNYSVETIYVGEVPKASVLKLSLNNIGLALPPLIAESLMLLKAWRVDLELFKKVSSKLWFGEVIKRYWARIFEEKPPRFKTWMAGKDYLYIANSLKYKKLPSHLSETLSSMYMEAAQHGLMDKDYPLMVKYYLDLVRGKDK
ncbi:MAG: 6-phosphogluconate dehydrogenase [Desulfurococcales archaeon ex4484_58]|nr:MAG: 6-phosphogluconate dehydrogenase [Desulfurococcales archaeon ex4484_58]